MSRIPLEVGIDLSDLVVLLGYYWSAVNSDLGDLGTKTYEETLSELSRQASCKITPAQLEHLVFHMKQAIFEKLKPVHVDLRIKNYHKIMKKLSLEIPQLFKELPSGEISFVNFEDRADERK